MTNIIHTLLKCILKNIFSQLICESIENIKLKYFYVVSESLVKLEKLCFIKIHYIVKK